MSINESPGTLLHFVSLTLALGMFEAQLQHHQSARVDLAWRHRVALRAFLDNPQTTETFPWESNWDLNTPSSHRKKKKKEGSSVPERSSRKEGTPGGALTHTLLSILFHPSDRKIEYVLLSQRRGGPRIANAVSVQGQTLSMSVVVWLAFLNFVSKGKNESGIVCIQTCSIQ